MVNQNFVLESNFIEIIVDKSRDQMKKQIRKLEVFAASAMPVRTHFPQKKLQRNLFIKKKFWKQIILVSLTKGHFCKFVFVFL